MGRGRAGRLGSFPAPGRLVPRPQHCLGGYRLKQEWREADTGKRLEGGWMPPVCSFFSLPPSASGLPSLSLSPLSSSLRGAGPFIPLPIILSASRWLCLCSFLSLFPSVSLGACLSLFGSVSVLLSFWSFSLHPSPPRHLPTHIPILTLTAYTLTWPSGVLARVTHQGSAEKGFWAVGRAHMEAWEVREGGRAGHRAPSATCWAGDTPEPDV